MPSKCATQNERSALFYKKSKCRQCKNILHAQRTLQKPTQFFFRFCDQNENSVANIFLQCKLLKKSCRMNQRDHTSQKQLSIERNKSTTKIFLHGDGGL